MLDQEEITQEIVIYGDNGNQINEVYIKNNKLHGYWFGYNKEDNTLSFGKYDQGNKVGKWFFWSEGNLTRVNYNNNTCLLYTSPSPRDGLLSRMPSSA